MGQKEDTVKTSLGRFSSSEYPNNNFLTLIKENKKVNNGFTESYRYAQRNNEKTFKCSLSHCIYSLMGIILNFARVARILKYNR